MAVKDIKVGVLGGGVSPEREISFISAGEVVKSLERNGVAVVFIDIFTSQKEKVKELICQHNIDVAFIALHGEFGEDGQIQQILEELELPYTGSGPQASSLAANKVSSKEIFLREGIATAAYYLWQDVPADIKYPLVVKPCCGGSSLGVSVVRDQRQLQEALKSASSLQTKIFLEEYIEGREFTVGILDNKPLGVVEIVPKEGFFDFNSKYREGAVQLKTDPQLKRSLYEKIQAQGLAAHCVLGCRHSSRVDLVLDALGNPFVLEVNSIPGLTSHSLLPLSAKCCGIGFDELVLKMVRLGLNEKIQAKKI
ncbi:MAG: D-alanine--D-alanine ligase [Candidatus Omnitrophota bacterium]|nr:MAG: D-alanine--D-alanine ligase [Candidatus Omnitrophota bacterium]